MYKLNQYRQVYKKFFKLPWRKDPDKMKDNKGQTRRTDHNRMGPLARTKEYINESLRILLTAAVKMQSSVGL